MEAGHSGNLQTASECLKLGDLAVRFLSLRGLGTR